MKEMQSQSIGADRSPDLSSTDRVDVPFEATQNAADTDLEAGYLSDGRYDIDGRPTLDRRDTVAFSFALIELMMEDLEAENADDGKVEEQKDNNNNAMEHAVGYSTSMDSNDRGGSTLNAECDEKEDAQKEMMRFIDEQYANCPVHIGYFQDEEWSVIYTDHFKTAPSRIFQVAWSEDAVREIHGQRGSSELKIGSWTQDADDTMLRSDQPTTWKRELEYICPIKDAPPFMPSQTEVYETQRFRFYGRNKLVFDVSISTPNIKYGDHFILLNKYTLSASSDGLDQSQLECAMAMKWVKKTMLRKVITKKAQSDKKRHTTIPRKKKKHNSEFIFELFCFCKQSYLK